MNAARIGSRLLVLLAVIPAVAAAQDIQPRMGAPVPGLSSSDLDLFENGKVVFNKLFSAAEGLGPNFNDTACEGCHLGPASGGGSGKFVTRFGKALPNPPFFDPLASLGGSLLQAESIDITNCQEVVPPEADISIHRITPPTFGFGFVEAIDDNDILFYEANPPAGISGKAHWVQPLEDPLGPQRVGRFGWKAQVATVLTFSGDASANEMGLTNRLVTTEQAPNGDLVKLAQCDAVADPEDGPDGQGFDAIDRMTHFQRFLAKPPQTPKSGMTGETLFAQVGCADCHIADPYTTITVAEPALSNQQIKPYSDFLLHDIGTGDGVVQGMGDGTEFRTPPLWGLLPRAVEALIHDGSASGASAKDNLRTAIAAHANEAAAARAGFDALGAGDQDHVLNFLLSLGQLEFDFERNHGVDDIDWFFIFPSMTGPGTNSISPDDFLAITDVDQDGDFDLRDVGAFQRAYTGN